MKRILTLGAAAAVALGSATAAGPALADTTGPAGVISPTVSQPGVSSAGLADAVSRDLGLTPEEFTAAGEAGKQAAAAAKAFSGVPGYVGTRLQDGRILVSGSGPELEARVAELTRSVPLVSLESPAAAETAARGSELAVSTHQLFEAFVREVGPQDLQAVAYSRGKFVIRTGSANAAEASLEGAAAEPGSRAESSPGTGSSTAGAGKVSATDFVARFANVELKAGTDLAPEADIVGGQGYISDTQEVCSTGFAAFDPAGLPSVLTAGHCSDDGAARQATLEPSQGTPAGVLGTFGFSQFGGPGNSPILGDEANPGNVGTDVAVIGSLRTGLDPQPAASTWDDPALADEDVKIIGTAAPVEGQPVCRSGRTSGWSCGTVDEVGIYFVQGKSSNPADLRAFSGFKSYAIQSSGGDSGGPWLSGNYAVGIHAAGEGAGAPVNFAVAATLNDALAVLPGYQLELFLNKPAVTSPGRGGKVDAGQTIAGTVAAAPASAVAAGSAVRITVTGQESFEVPVDGEGNWQFTAPEAPKGKASSGKASAEFRFTVETVNGLSASGSRAYVFEWAAPAPPVTGPEPQPPVTEPDPVPPAAEPQPDSVPPAAEPQPDPVPAPDETQPAPSPLAPAGSVAVVEPPAAAPADTDPVDTSLAVTGADGVLTAAVAALVAIAVGGVLMVLARRRRNRHTPRP